MIEMFNAVNALSEEKSILQTGLLINPFLLVAIALSFSLHLVIVYIPFFGDIFATDPLTKNDWILTIALAAPVILLDEFVKIFARAETNARLARLKDQ
jgi:Ca2+-transporting ATPase